MVEMYTSGGMYKQILLLNHERMILGRAYYVAFPTGDMGWIN